jgi:hypothetical protein
MLVLGLMDLYSVLNAHLLEWIIHVFTSSAVEEVRILVGVQMEMVVWDPYSCRGSGGFFFLFFKLSI